MNNFNFNRFARTFKWYFYEQRGKLLKWSVIALIVTLAVELFFVFILKKANAATDVPAYQIAVQSSCAMSTLYVIIAILVAFSNVFSWLKNKQKRAAFLTLPATNLERWIIAIIFALILFPVGIALGYFLGDIVRTGLYYVMGEEWLPGYKYYFDLFKIQSGFNLSMFSSMLWSASCFILAGTWLRKGQFVFGFVFWALILFLLSRLSMTLRDHNIEFLRENSTTLKYGVSIFFLLVSIFHFWLSYKLFTRYQIITSKWTNL